MIFGVVGVVIVVGPKNAQTMSEQCPEHVQKMFGECLGKCPKHARTIYLSPPPLYIIGWHIALGRKMSRTCLSNVPSVSGTPTYVTPPTQQVFATMTCISVMVFWWVFVVSGYSRRCLAGVGRSGWVVCLISWVMEILISAIASI